jgi:hypothetical protein
MTRVSDAAIWDAYQNQEDRHGSLTLADMQLCLETVAKELDVPFTRVREVVSARMSGLGA